MIEFCNIEYIYNKNTCFETIALKNLSFKVSEGEILSICGNTGSGKSTLIKLINGLLIPDNGQVKIAGKNISEIKNKKALRKKIGMVFQSPDHQIFEDSVKKELIFAPLKFGQNKREALKSARKSSQMCNLDYDKFKNRNPFELSGGEKRKVAIASIISYFPDILIFDEPTAGLDGESLKNLNTLFEQLKLQNKTIIVISHNMDFNFRHARNILVLNQGRKVFYGSVKKMISSYSGEKFRTWGLEKPFKAELDDIRKNRECVSVE
ncbi:MAG: energy-coupling factor ABC transporter ATP-binding protein [Candidatus Muiribacteriota bacterium]